MENTKASKFEGMMNKLSDVLMPIAEKMQNFKLLAALTASMQATLPVTIIGSFACLVAFLDLGGWQDFLAAHPMIPMVCMTIQSLTLSILGLYILLIMPYLYASKLGMREAVTMIPMTVAAYLLLTPSDLYTAIRSEWLGHKGLISVIVITFLVVRVTKFFLDHHICIRMPAGVPKFVEDGLAIVVPAAVILVVCACVEYLMAQTSFGSIHNVIYAFLQKPFQFVGLSMIGQVLVEACASLAMFLGLHSMTIVGIVSPITTAASMENLAAWTAGEPLPNIVCSTFTGLSSIGGGGCLLVPIIAFLLFSKSKKSRSISRVALVPGIFSVTEPMLFGLPIMLNPVTFIPLMVTTIFNQSFSYIVIATGLVGRFTGVTTSWTIPNIINVCLTNSTPVRAVIALLVEFAIDLAIWYPFVKLMDRKDLMEEEENAVKEIEA